MKKIVLFTLIGLLFLSCNRDEEQVGIGFIPEFPFSRHINIDNPQYSSLRNVGGYAYLDEGYRGIIIVQEQPNRFLAIERTCSYRSFDDCSKLHVDESGIFIKCGTYAEDASEGEEPEFEPCCNSRFHLSGDPFEGPAVVPLKLYSVIRNGNILNITN